MTDADLPSDEALLAKLDEADRHLRACYLRLADDPDAVTPMSLDSAIEHRGHLARLVGLAALGRWRERRPTAPAETPAPRDHVDESAEIETIDEDAPIEAPIVESSPPVADAPKPDVAGPDAVRAFAAAFGSKKTAPRAAQPVPVPVPVPALSSDWQSMLRTLLDELGPPGAVGAIVDVIDQLDAMTSVTSIPRWSILPPDVQQPWLSMLVARARALGVSTPAERARMTTIMGRCTEWSREFLPGHVNGLQMRHAPQSTSWHADARTHWSWLQRASASPAPSPASVRGPTATRERAAEAPSDDESEAKIHLPTLEATGKRVIIFGNFGGEAANTKVERLQRRTAVLIDWIEAEHAGRAVRGIREGRVAAVVVLQGRCSHKWIYSVIEATRIHGVLVQYANKGGLSRIVTALETLDGRLGAHRPGVELTLGK